MLLLSGGEGEREMKSKTAECIRNAQHVELNIVSACYFSLEVWPERSEMMKSQTSLMLEYQ